MLNLQKNIKNNSLEKLISTYNLKANYHKDFPNLVQLCYHQIDTPKNDITNECRGIILDTKNDYKVVCYPFYRFGDYNPSKNKVDFNNCKFYKKIDGSICTLYYYGNKWRVSTKGLPDANGLILDKNITFNDYFWQIWHKLEYVMPNDINNNYVFELKFPNNQNIVQTNEESITLLAIRNKNTFEEYHIEDCNTFNWKIVKSVNKNLEEILEELKYTDPLQNEGYVACDINFNRCKIKSPQYEQIHMLKTNFDNTEERQINCDRDNFRRICEIIRTNNVKTFLDLPKYKSVENLYNKTKIKYDNLVNHLENFLKSIENLEGKELGMMLKGKDKFYNGFAFNYKQGKIKSIKDYLFNTDIKNFEQLINSKIN